MWIWFFGGKPYERYIIPTVKRILRSFGRNNLLTIDVGAVRVSNVASVSTASTAAEKRKGTVEVR
jgi:hypothetical protein